MLESEEKSHHRLPLTLLKAKDRALNDMDEGEDDAIVAGQKSEEDSKDEDPEVDLPNALRSAFARLSTRQDELAHR